MQEKKVYACVGPKVLKCQRLSQDKEKKVHVRKESAHACKAKKSLLT